MAREKHLTSVHIGNFKRFKGLQVDNLGQFNLVVGDNNTGKTSFLEALVLDEECYPYENVKNLLKLLAVRKSSIVKGRDKDENIYIVISSYSNNQDTAVSNLSLHFTYSDYQSLVLLEKGGVDSRYSHVKKIAKAQNSEQGFQIYVNHLKEGVKRYYKVMTLESLNTGLIILKDSSLTDSDPIKLKNSYSYLNFMPFGAGYDDDLIGIYKGEIDRRASRRRKLQENLKLFIPQINDIRLQDSTVIIYEDGQDLGTPLYTYGEGAVKFFRILCYMAIAEGKRLMIDEIDTGIHHTKFVQFWKTLIQAAKAYDVQLFATTHNKECLQYYIEALKLAELEEERGHSRVLRFSNHNDTVMPRVYDWEELLVASELNHELRGDWL